MSVSSYNVMLVNDDLFEVDLVRRAVVESRSLINLTVAKGGDSVLNWFGAGIAKKEQIPHLILMDLQLPRLEGLAALRQIRANEATRDIPIVVFSTRYTQEDVLMSYSAGANSFVDKPADYAHLTEFFRERLSYWMPAH
jgi:two-component system, response regulator